MHDNSENIHEEVSSTSSATEEELIVDQTKTTQDCM